MGTSLKDLRNLLEKFLQWECDDSGKHIRYRFKVNGRTVAETHYSHSWRGTDQISNKMLMQMALEMRCSLGTLKSLLQGKESSKKNYYEELFNRGHISQDEYIDLCREGNSTTKN